MKRLIFLATGLVLLFGVQAMMNCSKPLESIDDGTPDPGPKIIIDTVVVIDTVMVIDTTATIDTIFHTDTVFVIDTTVLVDTIIQIDTLIVYDTITLVDTVIVVVPDTSGSPVVCARLNYSRQEIVWLFRNSEGMFRLEFVAATKWGHPKRILTITIDEQQFEWDLAEHTELIVEQHLEDNTKVIITTNKPCSFGHDIDICLTLREV